jgi:hypothetical protein
MHDILMNQRSRSLLFPFSYHEMHAWEEAVSIVFVRTVAVPRYARIRQLESCDMSLNICTSEDLTVLVCFVQVYLTLRSDQSGCID